VILTRVTGGLGNQMFQYACARRLAHRVGTELGLDTTSFRTEWLHSYALDRFKIAGAPLRRSAVREILAPVVERPRLRVVNESYGPFNDHVLEEGNDVMLIGHWQSEKYFLDIADLIRAEFTVREELTGIDLEVAERIERSNSVCLHVRRGDFVSVAATSAAWGTCGLDYYRRSIDLIATIVADPVFFVFSNDAVWARAHITPPYPTHFVTHNYRRPHSRLESYRPVRMALRVLKRLFVNRSHADMRLMSLCKHFIIANSTYSWWAAWLGRDRSKIVCAPRTWFAGPAARSPEDLEREARIYEDLIPVGWNRM